MKQLKTSIFLCVEGSILLLGQSISVFAANINTLEATLVSDYDVRGVSFSNKSPALQGGYNHDHNNGIYAGIWFSTVDFDTEAEFEFDMYAGNSTEISSLFTLDYGIAYYTYPQQSAINFGEAYIGASISNWSGKFWYSNDYIGSDGYSQYIEINSEWPLPKSFTFSAHVGHYFFADKVGYNDYSDASLGFSTNYVGFNFSLIGHNSYSDSFGENGEPRVVLTISKTVSF